MMTFNTAEKIETIVRSRTSGSFGEFQHLDERRSLVTVEGCQFIVATDPQGWSVARVGSNFVFVDQDLYEAAKMACHAGA